MQDLYRDVRTRPLPIRLLGIALAKFRLDRAQLPLFDNGEGRVLAVDRVREKYGYDAVHLASTIGGCRGLARRTRADPRLVKRRRDSKYRSSARGRVPRTPNRRRAQEPDHHLRVLG